MMEAGETLRVRFIGANNGLIHQMHTDMAVRSRLSLATARPFGGSSLPHSRHGAGATLRCRLEARRPGKWLIHCHIGHHTTNNNVEEEGGGALWS